MSAYISTTDAAERLGVSPRRVQALFARGRLTGLRIGRTLVIDSASVRTFRRLPAGRPKKST